MGVVTVSTRALVLLFVAGFAVGAVGILNVVGLVIVFGVKEWRW